MIDGREQITIHYCTKHHDWHQFNCCDCMAEEVEKDTLKAVGEWLYARLGEDISNFTQGFITLGELETLKEGRMP